MTGLSVALRAVTRLRLYNVPRTVRKKPCHGAMHEVALLRKRGATRHLRQSHDANADGDASDSEGHGSSVCLRSRGPPMAPFGVRDSPGNQQSHIPPLCRVRASWGSRTNP